MATIHIYGAKGGVGTSTVAAMAALDEQRQGHTVVLTSADGDHGDLRAILGLADGYEDEPITFVAPAGSPVVTIIDHGTTPPPPADWEHTFMVTRACYLALRRALKHPTRPDGIILLLEKGRPLGVRDVEDVVGAPVVATLDVEARVAGDYGAPVVVSFGLDAKVSRAIDAGILSSARHIQTLRLPVSV